MLRPNELVIGDHNYREFLNVEVAGEVKGGDRKGYGLVKRDWQKYPAGCYANGPFKKLDFPLIPRSEWPERIKDKIAQKSQNSDVRLQGNNGQSIPSRDQNGKGYCWAHSSVSCLLVVRANQGEPYADLSAFAVACVIKNFRDEGGWGAQSLDFIMSRGVPTSATWPQQGMKKEYDNPKTWEEAAKYKVTSAFIDMDAAQYDRNLTFDQVATCLLLNIPVVVDFNWWSHSVCALDLTEGQSMRDTYHDVESGKRPSFKLFEKIFGLANDVTAGFGLRIWNSWSESWSDRGQGLLTGSKAIPDGSVAPRLAMAS